MQLLDEVRSAWGWVGIEPIELVDDNDFGNIIIEDIHGQYWRLCPEEPYCEVVARSRTELDRLAQDQEFLSDWRMRALVDEASQLLGGLAAGQKYCLKISGVLGGQYGGDNLGIISFDELINASGHIAQKIADLSNGALIKLSATD